MAETAVVTGCTGFVAGHVVKALLEKGYNVRGSVRSLQGKDKFAHLERLAAALPGTLQLFEADLMQAGSFDKAVNGAAYVFHCASPFTRPTTVEEGKELVHTAITGTENVLRSVPKSETVKRVVLTSSCAAILKRKSGPSNGKLYTEDDWNSDASPEEHTTAYSYSKVAAEKAAWELSKKHGFDLVTINPSFIVGPTLTNSATSISVQTIKDIAEGRSNSLSVQFVIDVRDVAKAHVLAAEHAAAKGRYIVSLPAAVHNGRMMQILEQRFPDFQLKTCEIGPDTPLFDNSKVQKELGMSLIPFDEAIIDSVVTAVQLGIAKPVYK